MRLLLLLLFVSANYAFAQSIDPTQVYGMHTRLGINGPVRSVTAYKYSKLKYNATDKKATTGTLYSVVKNYYDTAGRVIRDSVAHYYNKTQAEHTCHEYAYHYERGKHTITVSTTFNCAADTSISTYSLITTDVKGSLFTFKEYTRHLTIRSHGTTEEKELTNTYRVVIKDSLVESVVYDLYEKGEKVREGRMEYAYDKYGNFTQTTERIDEQPKNEIRHEVLVIDAYGNATLMLNYEHGAKTPSFMTRYEIEYY